VAQKEVDNNIVYNKDVKNALNFKNTKTVFFVINGNDSDNIMV